MRVCKSVLQLELEEYVVLTHILFLPLIFFTLSLKTICSVEDTLLGSRYSSLSAKSLCSLLLYL
jgi:hypothetical protein